MKKMSMLKRICASGAIAAVMMSMPVISYAEETELIKIESEYSSGEKDPNFKETEVVILMDSISETVAVSEKKAEILKVSAERETNASFLGWIKGKIETIFDKI